MVHVAFWGGSGGYAAGVTGSFMGEPLDIDAILDFELTGYPFTRAVIAGEIAGHGLEVMVTPVVAGLDSSSGAYIVNGAMYADWDESAGGAKMARFSRRPSLPFAFYIALNDAPNRLIVRGHTSSGPGYVDGALRFSGGRHVELTGLFTGPTGLLLLILGVTVQWLR
jgi:hypothetical protein